AARGKQGKALGRVWGSVLTHISLLLILGGGVVRGIWGERGDISFREGDTTDHFVVNRSASKLPFSVTLEKFEIETYSNQEEPSHPAAGDIHEQLQIAWKERNLEWTLPIRLDAVQQFGPDGADRKPEDSFQLTILRRITDFVVDMDTGEVTSRSDAFNNPAILVEVVNNGHTNAQWAFARYPDFNMHSEEDKAGRGAQLTFRYEVMVPAQPQATVKDYKSTLVISEDGVVVRKKTIEVNAPLSYRGYTFYQSGYNPKDPKWTSLQVVRDPGVPIVYAGFGFMILGLIAVFYVCPGGRPATRPGVTKEGASSDDTI
ncbi:MAG: cytochrome c biogenesis protein ResB, partial [Kiritimatiellia bacterium]|nr:cytochrome c biogenesis protein ResB [Kiritimatiellia bacterium]